MPNLEQGDKFEIMLPPWRSFWSADIGQLKVWFSFIFVLNLIPAKGSSLK